MMADIPDDFHFDTRLNEPYGPEDGVSHTLDIAGAAQGLLSVMIEVRNDLITSRDAERAMAEAISPWVQRAVARINDGVSA